MTGIFDSGLGGIRTASLLHALSPREDILLFADRRNAPYGTKSKDELEEIVNNNIQNLLRAGSDRVLIACCTAGSVYERIRPELRARSIEIITPTAKAAADASKGRIAVIATEATVRSHAFSLAVRRIRPDACVTEIPAQRLVSLTEAGECDGRTSEGTRGYLDRLAERLLSEEPDCLILGCTHFPALSGELEGRLPGVKIISSSLEGAAAAAALITRDAGEGRLIYLG